MAFYALPKVLQSEVLCYLTPSELIASLSHVNRAFRASVDLFICLSTEYRESYLGMLSFQPTPTDALRKVMFAADSKQSKILSFAVNYTDGGMYQNKNEYWAQNMLEYSGTMHTANGVENNVTVCGTFLGEYYAHSFSCKFHNDLPLHRNAHFGLPKKYKECIFPYDSFLKSIPPCLGASLSIAEISEWSSINGPNLMQDIERVSDMIYRVKVPESETVGLVTHVGVARPSYSTCPVKTLMVFTKLRASQPDLRQWYGLTTMEEVLKRTDFPPVNTSQTLSGYSYVEFADTEGPLLWVQFTAFEETQVEIKLKTRRAVRHVEILIVDGEDRRSDFRYFALGVDTMYVVFGGIIIPMDVSDFAERKTEDEALGAK